jgi:hypothetical protein
MSTDRVRDDSGVALITALLAAIVLGGVAVVIFASAQTNLEVSASTRDFDDAIHTAEAGADLVVDAMNADDGYSTGHATPVGSERAWAVEQAMAAYEDAAERDLEPHESLHDGHFAYGMRIAGDPADPDANDRVYGVGIVEGREQHVRAVVYEVADNPFNPEHAVLTQGPLEFSGGPDVTGDAGAVHSNTDLELGGNSNYIEQTASSSGSCDPGQATIGVGGCQSYQPEINIPPIDARYFYPQHVDHEDVWYDLCRDGTVRRPSAGGPCQGTNVVATGSLMGWEHQSNQHRWSRSGNASLTGIFYVHERNVRITGQQDLEGVTIFVEKADDTVGGSSGNFYAGGGTQWTPYLPAVSLVADRDIQMSGSTESGAVIAGEQVDWGGNLGAAGAGAFGILIAQDLGPNNGNTPGSPISKNRVHGNIHVTYNGDVTLPVLDGLRVAAWNEL